MDELKAALAKFDTDGSGTLTVEDFFRIATRPAGMPLSESEARELISGLDANGTGMLRIEDVARAIASTGTDLGTIDAIDASPLVLITGSHKYGPFSFHNIVCDKEDGWKPDPDLLEASC